MTEQNVFGLTMLGIIFLLLCAAVRLIAVGIKDARHLYQWEKWYECNHCRTRWLRNPDPCSKCGTFESSRVVAQRTLFGWEEK